MTRLILIAALCLASCTTSRFSFGADEFVLDSYKIREGKFAMLEMEGISTPELDDELLEVNESAGTVELMGMVEVSQIPVDGTFRLYDLLFQAHIPPQANLFKSYVLRNGNTLPVDLCKLIKEGDMAQNIAMQGGDKIYIANPDEACVMVMGDVPQPKTIALPNGFMPLKQAVVETGSNGGHIEVIRGALRKPKIYAFKWEHVIALPNDSLLLMPGDIVYVNR